MLNQKSVVIIGAGLAGLAAANHLTKHRIPNIILEARDRAGGRIEIDHSLGIPLSKGATWIHGIHGNPITQFYHDLQSKFFAYNPDLFSSFHRNGQVISKASIQRFKQRIEIGLEHAKDFGFQCKDDVPLSAALHKVYNVTPDEQDLFFKKLKYFENFQGDDYKYLSARHWDDEKIIPGKQGLLSDAYEKVLQSLTKECRIDYNTQVKSIITHPDHVKVITNHISYDANSVIITVPLGVLKNNTITFIPDLPVHKKKSITQLGMGLFNIIALRYSRIFWDDATQAFFLPEEKSCAIFFNLHHFNQQPILLGYVGGGTARGLEQQSDSTIISGISKNFQKYFGKSALFPESFFITRWAQDPYSLGSYSYYAVGSSVKDREILAETISNQLYFAGEATHSDFPATTHGAYLSGVREAEKIVRKFHLL